MSSCTLVVWFWLCRSVVCAHVAGCLVYSCMLRWFRSRLLLLLLFLLFFLFWFVPRLVASFVLFRFLLLVLALAPPPSAAAAAAPPDGGWIGCALLRSLPFLVVSGSLFRLLMLFFARAPSLLSLQLYKVDPAETRSPNQSNFRKKYEPGSNKNYMVRKGSPNRSGTAHLHSSPLNTSRARAG